MRFLSLLALFTAACIGAPPDASNDAGSGSDSDVQTISDATRPDASTRPDADAAIPDTCDDGELNGDETDVDCGGSCLGCSPGHDCDVDADCVMGLCDGDECVRHTSCAEIVDDGLSDGDGEYPVDADGDGDAPPVLAHCDMTSDGGVGYTMFKIEDAANLLDDQQAYEEACASAGMEIIVPRTRGHAKAIYAFNGDQTPNLVGVYPKADAEETRGLQNWTGRCQGEPCSFYLTDRLDNSADCGDYEPSGDSDPNGALQNYRGSPSEKCPIGNFNDRDRSVRDQGYVICSTNDAGPPTYRSCLEINEADSLQATGLYGPLGLYEIQPDGADDPFMAYCDFVWNGGGYTYLKMEEANPLTTARAEDRCAEFGLRLIIPRTPRHLTNAFFVGLDPNIGSSGTDDYLTLLGVYPTADGASCGGQAMTSENGECEMEAADGGPYFVHDSTGFVEPDGSNSRQADSLVYDWAEIDALTKELVSITEPESPPTTTRFICSAGDKMGP